MAKKKLIFNRIVLSVLLIITGATATVAQPRQDHSTKPLNYGFVSPNTKENLTLSEAINSMRAPEELALQKKAINLGCVIRSNVSASRALGSWSDGAEHSVVLRVRSDESSVRYILSRLGRDAKQKSILYFHPASTGPATMYTLKPRNNTRNLVDLANRLERAGIAFRTLVPVGNNTWIYVVDSDQKSKDKVVKAAKHLRARLSSERGTAAFVGADAASQADAVFEQEIHTYENKNPNLPATCDVQRKRATSKTH